MLLLLASDLTLAGGSNGSVDQGGAPVGSSSRLSFLKINLTLVLLCKSCLAGWTPPFLTGVSSIMVFER